MLRRHGTRLIALLVIVIIGALARLPEATESERKVLAERFKFEREALPGIGEPSARRVRPVHKSLKDISAWISSVGAAIALSDIDGDGLANDVCYVDPRTDQVIVAPVPTAVLITEAGYRPFVLEPPAPPADPSNPGSKSFDPTTTAPMGCLAGDLNEDGRMDLLVYYWGRSPVVFLRTADPIGPLSWQKSELIPGPPRRWWYSNAATLADLDGDGHVDVVIGNYFPESARILDHTAPESERQWMQHSMSRAFNGGGARFFLWRGASTGVPPAVVFEEVTGLLEGDPGRGWTLAVGAADLDGDQLPEVYLANDFGPDRLLHNRSTPGRLRFAPLYGEKMLGTPSSKVLGRDSFKGMGVDFGDLNGDGRLDIFVSNIASEYALEESHFAFLSTESRNPGAVMRRGKAPYVDRSEALGLSRSGWAWDAKMADFDNDGVLEVLQATGFVKGVVNRWPELHEVAMGNDELLAFPGAWHRFRPDDDLSGGDRNPFFVKGKRDRYVDIARQLRIVEPAVSRGIAIADVDGDGCVDFAVANQWGPSGFYRNVREECKLRDGFLGLRLLVPLQPGESGPVVQPDHPKSNLRGRAAIGAEAIVHLPRGGRRVAQVDGGNGHSGKRSHDLHFGLGARGVTSVRVDVRWRSPRGHVYEHTLHLRPGWHTVMLDSLQDR